MSLLGIQWCMRTVFLEDKYTPSIITLTLEFQCSDTENYRFASPSFNKKGALKSNYNYGVLVFDMCILKLMH